MYWVKHYFKDLATLQGANIEGVLTEYFFIGSLFIVNERNASCCIYNHDDLNYMAKWLKFTLMLYHLCGLFTVVG